MNLEEYESQWRAHDHGGQPPEDTSLILNQVRMQHRDFERKLVQRDISEVAAAVLVAGFFGAQGFWLRSWPMLLCAAGGVFVGAFFIIDRVIQSGRRPKVEDTTISYLTASLAQVKHQIWLLRNVFWWYLLPLVPGLAVFLGLSIWDARRQGIGEQVVALAVAAICAAAFWVVFRINQREVRNSLEPQRQELEAMLQRLESDVR